MRALTTLAAILLLSGPVGGREWQPYDVPLSGSSDAWGTMLYYDDGVFERWGTAPSWAEEQQVGFRLPSDGPWQIVAVQLWIGGGFTHNLLFRQPDGSLAGGPGPIMASIVPFEPGYPADPEGPDRWVEVDVSGLDLRLEGGEEIFVGATLDGIDDGIGLDSSNPSGHSWGFYNGEWIQDSALWGVDAGVRLVLAGVLVPLDVVSWGTIKGLYLPPTVD